MEVVVWYAPKLKEYAIEDIVKKISINASSDGGGICVYNPLPEGQGSVECGGFPNGSGGDISFCVQYGPLNGCNAYGILSCSVEAQPILSNGDLSEKL